MKTIKCGTCGKDVKVTQLNRVSRHGAAGITCLMSGTRPEYAVLGKRVAG